MKYFLILATFSLGLRGLLKESLPKRFKHWILRTTVFGLVLSAGAQLDLQHREDVKSREEKWSGRLVSYAKLRGYTRPAGQLWDEQKASNLVGYSMSSYTPGEPVDYPPLQAADIWAYSLGHMGEHHPPKKTEAEIAFNFFSQQALNGWLQFGHKFFELFDRTRLLIALGEFYDVA